MNFYWGGIKDKDVEFVYLLDIVLKRQKITKSYYTPLQYGTKFSRRAGIYNLDKYKPV